MKLNSLKKHFAKSMAVLLAAGMVLSPTAMNAQASPADDLVEYTKNENAMRNVMYYGDWSIWGGQGNFYPKGIPADQLTHLNFAFLDFDANGNLKFTDKDAAVGAPVGMPGVQWEAANAGILSAMQDLRADNPNMRIGISIGGWSKSNNFSPVAANPTARKNFVNNVMKYVKYANMDFVDLDWEYPGSYRLPDTVDNKNDEGTVHASEADMENYIILLQDLRDALDKQGEELGKYYELTVALPAPKATLDLGIDIPRLFEVVDFANIMTYDMRGAWDGISGHQTGLYTNPDDPFASSGLSVDDSVNYLISQGAPSNKIVIGAAFYTRGWEKISNDGGVEGLPGLFGSAEKINKDGDFELSYGALNEAPIKHGEGGRCGGVWGFGSMDKLHAKYPGLVEYWDDYAKAPYLYNESTGAFFTYDNERSIQEKANYVHEKNLGGIISWMQSQDAETDTPGRRDKLTKAIKNGLFGSTPLTKYYISDPAMDVTATVSAYDDYSGKGYEFTIKNNAVANESGEVLSLLEKASETIKSPKVYVKTKSGATFSTGGYGTGVVSNADGYGIADLSTVYDNQTIGQGNSVTFRLKVNGIVSFSDIESIEITQRMYSTGTEFCRYNVDFKTTGTDPGETDPGTDPVDPDPEDPDPVDPDPEDPDPEDPDPVDPDPSIPEYNSSASYFAGDLVIYNGQVYKAKWWSQGTPPSSDPYGPWELVE